MSIVKSLSLFIIAGSCEIGGGYLIWLWAWKADHFKPDRYDIIGALFCILGVQIMFYVPRTPT
jgi:small multidrug resistance family-3 protein